MKAFLILCLLSVGVYAKADYVEIIQQLDKGGKKFTICQDISDFKWPPEKWFYYTGAPFEAKYPSPKCQKLCSRPGKFSRCIQNTEKDQVHSDQLGTGKESEF